MIDLSDKYLLVLLGGGIGILFHAAAVLLDDWLHRRKLRSSAHELIQIKIPKELLASDLQTLNMDLNEYGAMLTTMAVVPWISRSRGYNGGQFIFKDKHFTVYMVDMEKTLEN
jgi:hypothetical protein